MSDEKPVESSITKPGVVTSVLNTCHAVVNDIDDKIVAILVLGLVSIAAMFLKLEGAKDVVLTACGGIGGLALGRRNGTNGTNGGNGK